MLTVLTIILIVVVAFVVLGLLGWLVQGLGWIGAFLGEGITGCLGCCGRFIWYIFAAIVIISLISALV